MTVTGYDPNDRRDVQTKEQLVEMREERMAYQVALDTQMVMSTPEGRRFMHSVLWQICEIHKQPYQMGDLVQQRHQDYVLGQQSVGWKILEQLEKLTPSETLQLRAEAIALKRALEEEIAAEDALFEDALFRDDEFKPQEQDNG